MHYVSVYTLLILETIVKITKRCTKIQQDISKNNLRKAGLEKNQNKSGAESEKKENSLNGFNPSASTFTLGSKRKRKVIGYGLCCTLTHGQ